MAVGTQGNVANHPLELTSFIGRRQVIADARRLLSTSRLGTLTGGGGIGKTRLTLRVAAQVGSTFDDGVWMVDLSAVRDPSMVAPAVATTLGLREPAGGRSPTEMLTDYLAGRQLLLVLDNCEHLVDAVSSLAETLLRAAPGLRILATSRESLAVPGEAVLPVPPLSLPDPRSHLPHSAISQYEAVSLFVDRATAVMPSFGLTEENQAAVVGICQRLEGLPLAIELAAARVRLLSPQEILDRLTGQYNVLARGGRGRPERHQTLQACIAWSYDLCTAAERTLWARLSVFSGGFELDAAEEICAGGELAPEDVLVGLHSLLEKSILLSERRGPVVRYRPLESIREFGWQRLREDGEDGAVSRRHRDWYERLVEQAYADWASPRQVDWFARLDREHANVRAAIDYCLSEPGEAESALRMLPALYHFYCWGRGWTREGRRWIDRALALASTRSAIRATVLLRDAALAVSGGDTGTAGTRLAEGRALAEELGEPAVVALADYAEGLAAQYRGELADSIATFERALAVLPGPDNLPLRLDLLLGLAVSAGAAGDEERAVACHETTLALTEPAGESFHRSYALWALGLLAFQKGEVGRAADLQRRSLSLRQQLGDVTGAGFSLEFLAWAEEAAGHHLRAATLLGAADQVWEIIGTSMQAFRHLVAHHEDCQAGARAALGNGSFESAFGRGRDLPLDDVIRYALEEKAQQPTTAAESVLTAREWEVARLIAEGRSNREIAATLVISPRTAEAHAEHIRAKLGFTSRAQVATWVAEQDQN